MALSRYGTEKNLASCYAGKQGSGQRIMGTYQYDRCRPKGAPVGQIWDKSSTEMHSDCNSLQHWVKEEFMSS